MKEFALQNDISKIDEASKEDSSSENSQEEKKVGFQNPPLHKRERNSIISFHNIEFAKKENNRDENPTFSSSISSKKLGASVVSFKTASKNNKSIFSNSVSKSNSILDNSYYTVQQGADKKKKIENKKSMLSFIEVKKKRAKSIKNAKSDINSVFRCFCNKPQR